jgi:pimeloyl-ACP methyl ester carboxylesterase
VILADTIPLLVALLTTINPAAKTECVVMLHGLGRTELSMSRIESELKKDGFLVVNETYPSLTNDILKLSEVVGSGIASCRASGASTIHFVTHSMGGILVRVYFQTHTIPEAKRMVMLGPPNHGSEVVDKHRDDWWFKLATGPAGQQLATSGDTSIPITLQPIPLEIGIIAGTESIDPLLDDSLPRPNDGKVSVQSAMLPEMNDFITIPVDHTFMVYSSTVISHIKGFLRSGKFARLARN